MTDGVSTRASLVDVRTQVSREELGDLVAQFEDTYEAIIRQAAEDIVARDPGRRTRRLTLLWQIRLLAMARDALNQDDAVHALLDVWAVCLQLQGYLRDGDGRVLFGDGQHLAQSAADRCVQSVEQVAGIILAPNALDRAREAIEALAREHPIRGEFSTSTVRTAVQRSPEAADVLTAIVRAPLAPFRAVEGIDRGAAAIRGFTAVSARVNETVHDLPELIRLQAELLLMEIEDMESVQSALASFREFAQASNRFAVVAERLPADLRNELTLVLDEIDQRQANLQVTLMDAREVVDRLNDGMRQAEVSAVAVEEAAKQMACAGDAWTGTFQSITDMVASFRGTDDAGEGEPGGKAAPAHRETTGRAAESMSDLQTTPQVASRPGAGFDIREYMETAEALDRAAAQLTQLTAELHDLAASQEMHASLQEIEARMYGLIEHSRGGATALADHVAWRLVQLVALVFVLFVGYKGLSSVLARGRESGRQA